MTTGINKLNKLAQNCWLQPSKRATYSEVKLGREKCFYLFESNVYFPNGFSTTMFELCRTQRTVVLLELIFDID
jgi:hypothetical protein